MAFERAPVFKFNTPDDWGFNSVPDGAMVAIESTLEFFTKVRDISSGVDTPANAILTGDLSPIIVNENIFNFLYYADERDSTPENPSGTNSRILGMNPRTMLLEKEIKLPAYAHPGSCDRAAVSDKMYVRSATTTNEDNTAMSSSGGDRYMAVVDMVANRFLKKIPLNWKPRSSGAYNRYRDMHAVTTKEKPWIHLIDCPTDKIVFSAGSEDGTGYVQGSNWSDTAPTGVSTAGTWHDSPQGNDGGNATGHAVWVDANHFALLDRHNVNIQVFKINENFPPYTVTQTQIIQLPSASHSLRSFDGGRLFQDRVFFAAIEGTTGKDVPDSSSAMWKMTFDSASSVFLGNDGLVVNGTTSNVDKVEFNSCGGAIDDNIHHFGVGKINGRKIVAVPLTKSNTVHIIDVDTWDLDSTLTPTSPNKCYYSVGNGEPSKPGHADLYMNDKTNTWRIITTNHSGRTVSVIDLKTKSVTEVPIPTLTTGTGYVAGTGFTMSHANHIIGDKYYFFDAYYNEATGHKGTFYEMDIITMKITRSTVTGGHPVQSFS